MRRKAGITVVGLGLVAALGLWLTKGGNGDTAGTLTASGTVEATDVRLGFLVAGRIEEVTVAEGQRVSAGDTLARLDARELNARLQAAQADSDAAAAALDELRAGARIQEVASAEAAVAAAESRATEAGENATRARRLFDGGAISRQTLDRALTEARAAEATATQARETLDLTREGPRQETLRAARARLAQALARQESAKVAREHATVVAPFDGIVTVRHREPGETVGPGTPVLTLLDPDDRWVRIYVREDRLGSVRLGAAARIVSDTYPDRVIDGEVVFIGTEAEFTPRNVQTAEERVRLVYPVKVRVTNDPAAVLKPGLPADVTLEAEGT